MNNLLVLLLMFSGVLFICLKFSAWKDWKKYYATIQYAVLWSFIYSLVYYRKPLWIFTKLISPVINDLIYTLILAPFTLMLFLTYLPPKYFKQIKYIVIWAVLYTIAEWILLYHGYVRYDESWNILLSFAFNIMLFSLVTMHFKKPLLTWAITIILALGFMKLFPVQLY